MTNTKNSSNQVVVPEARAAMDRFKMEAAADFAVPAPTKHYFPLPTTYRLTPERRMAASCKNAEGGHIV